MQNNVVYYSKTSSNGSDVVLLPGDQNQINKGKNRKVSVGKWKGNGQASGIGKGCRKSISF